MTRISRRLTAVALAMLVFAGACEVTNPGPVQDKFLDEETSHAGLVRGAERMVLETANYVFYTTAIITRVLFPGGDTNSHDPKVQGGSLPPNEVNADWANVQQALFIAESALERGVAGENLAQAHIWAGYTYRILGENWCEWAQAVRRAATPERGARQRGTALHRGAQRGRQFHPDERGLRRARAGPGGEGRLGRRARRCRPGARQLRLRGPAGSPISRRPAAGSGGPTPTSPTGSSRSCSPSSGRTRWTTFARCCRSRASDLPVTVAGTGYYAESGDPRVAWHTIPDQPFANASLQGFGQVPWSNFKWLTDATPIHLGTGAEMLLYRAEGMLRDGDQAGGMELINQVRSMYISDNTGEPLASRTASSLEEAWTHLKTERMIEGLLEGRRLVDLRRWAADGSPGEAPYPDWEKLTPLFGEEPMATCFPISENERQRNPNLSG